MHTRRRGNVAVIAAILLVVLITCGALAVDISMMVSVRQQLTSSADACALSTLHYVSNLEALEEDPGGQARLFAQGFMPLNSVAAREVHLTNADVSLINVFENEDGIFDSYLDWTNASPSLYNGVRINARLGAGAGAAGEDNSLTPILGGILGQSSYEISRTSFAMLAPRNIVLVVDGSVSMSLDSTLENLGEAINLQAAGVGGARINLQEVWDAYPTGPAPYNGGSATNPEWGPVYGSFMVSMGYGLPDTGVDASYVPKRFLTADGETGDFGLLYLPPSVSWGINSADAYAAFQAPILKAFLTSVFDYNVAEAEAIMMLQDPTPPGETKWFNRVKVAMGLMGWNSGKPLGRWRTEGWGPAGDGDNEIDNNELVDIGVPLPADMPFVQNNVFDLLGWDLYIYLQQFADHGGGAYDDFRSCFGAKTLMSFLIEQIEKPDDYPLIQSALQEGQKIQPWTSTRLSIESFMNALGAFNNNDLIGLVRFGSGSDIMMGLQGIGEEGQSGGMNEVNLALLADYPSHGATNISGALQDAMTILNSEEAYTAGDWEPGNGTAQAPQAIGEDMIILLTDGLPACDWNPDPSDPENECPEEDESEELALATAEAAAATGIKLHIITIGSGSDPSFGEAMACAGREEGHCGLSAHFEDGYIANQQDMTDFFNQELLQIRGKALLVGHDLVEAGD